MKVINALVLALAACLLASCVWVGPPPRVYGPVHPVWVAPPPPFWWGHPGPGPWGPPGPGPGPWRP
jgi:hypothetical protein